MRETFEKLWNYCTSKKRVIPEDWNQLYQMLNNKKQNLNGSWSPPLPLILAAWHHTSPIEKQLRFKEHIKWAFDNKQGDEIGKYLRSLHEEEWYHFDEL